MDPDLQPTSTVKGGVSADACGVLMEAACSWHADNGIYSTGHDSSSRRGKIESPT